MATVQPASGDKLNSPDHSLLHRQIASDTSAPVKSIDIDSDGAIQGGTPLFQNINPTNLLSNGDFEAWSAGTSVAPDGWTLASAVVARESSTIKLGTYSSKGTYSAGAFQLNQDIHAAKGISYWKGRTVTLGCWVWCDTASRAILQIQDDTSTGGTNSSYHTGGSTWEWITVTKTITDSVDTDVVRVMLYVITGAASAYFDGAMLVEGSSAFAFADKPMPEVNPTARGILTLEQGQIKFPATVNASADANTLDDYEEGTFTPTCFDAATAGNEVDAYSENSGRYTKIGRLVHVRIIMRINGITAMTGGNDIFIRDLPFVILVDQGYNITGSCTAAGVFTFSGYLTFEGIENSAYGRIVENVTGTAEDYVIVSEFGTSGWVYIDLMYETS